MITEPEMADEPVPEGSGDLLGGADRRPPSSRTARLRPWWRALAAVLATSAVWAGVLRATDRGHDAAPDLHGYRIDGDPCVMRNLQPLTDALNGTGFVPHIPLVHRGPERDHLTCVVTGRLLSGSGWATDFTITVTVDLHKKSDPRAEFEDTGRVLTKAADLQVQDYTFVVREQSETVEPLAGLGDRAYRLTGGIHQAVVVLHGGAVFSLTLDAINQWTGGDNVPTRADGTPERPYVADTSALRPVLPETVRTLMGVLSGGT